MEPKTFGDYLGAWQQTHEGGYSTASYHKGGLLCTVHILRGPAKLTSIAEGLLYQNFLAKCGK